MHDYFIYSYSCFDNQQDLLPQKKNVWCYIKLSVDYRFPTYTVCVTAELLYDLIHYVYSKLKILQFYIHINELLTQYNIYAYTIFVHYFFLVFNIGKCIF